MENIANSQLKAVYSRPTIVMYGEFANLTAGGTGSTVEAGNQSSMRRP